MDKGSLKKRRQHRRRRNMLVKELRTNPMYRQQIHKQLRNDKKQEQKELREQLIDKDEVGMEEQPRRDVSF